MTNRNSWKTGVSINIPYFTKERMQELRENEIHFVEMCDGNLSNFVNFKSESKTLFKAASDCGITVRSVHLPFSPFGEIDPASTDKSVREEFFKVQSEILDISAENYVKIAVVHPSGEPYKTETREENLKYSVESMARLNEFAGSLGMTLAVENLPRTCILRDCKEIEHFIREIPDIRFAFDSNHSLSDSNADIIKAMGERIIATHISDYDFVDERHLLPGDGKVKWQEIMKNLEEVNYSGTWTYELDKCHLVSAEKIKGNHLKILYGEIK